MSTHGCTCWEPGVVEDPDCPRHGIAAFIPDDAEGLCEHGHLADLCLLCPREGDVDEEVDRRSDAAADRADTIIDRYDPDDRQPAGGDPYWCEEPSCDD